MDKSEIIKTATSESFVHGLTAGILGTTLSFLFILGSILYVWIKYPNNVKIVVGQIWYVISWVLGSFAEKVYLVNNIEGRVGMGIDFLNDSIDGLGADQVKITLVKNAARAAFIQDRVLIMRVQKNDSHGENLANVAFLYSQYLFEKVDPSLSPIQQEGIRLYTAKRILETSGREGLKVLEDKYYKPLIAAMPDIQTLLDQLRTIDRRGLFYSIFIQEMVFLGEKTLFNRTRTSLIQEEVTDFLAFLVNFAGRTHGTKGERRNFQGENISVALILVAREENRIAEDTEIYITYAKSLPMSIQSYYLLGQGRNLNFVRKVGYAMSKALDHVDLMREKKSICYFDDGGQTPSLFVLIRNRDIAPLFDRK